MKNQTKTRRVLFSPPTLILISIYLAIPCTIAQSRYHQIRERIQQLANRGLGIGLLGNQNRGRVVAPNYIPSNAINTGLYNAPPSKRNPTTEPQIFMESSTEIPMNEVIIKDETLKVEEELKGEEEDIDLSVCAENKIKSDRKAFGHEKKITITLKESHPRNKVTYIPRRNNRRTTADISVTEITETVIYNSSSPPDELQKIDIRRVVNSFSDRLSRVIGGTDNYFYSPFSISAALAMIYLGARGNTAKEMEKVLHYSEILGENNVNSIHELFHNFILSIKNNNNQPNNSPRLLVANGMFTQAKYQILPEYISAVKELYWSMVKNLDFINDAAGSLETINEWTSNQTAGKIPKILEKPLDPLTVLVLMNAIYFKGYWKNPFNTGDTNEQIFHKLDGSTKLIRFMVLQKKLPYKRNEEEGFEFLKLAYKGKYCMIIALPLQKNGFPSSALTKDLWINANWSSFNVNLKMPKFKMSYERELSKDMSKLGLRSLFEEHHANLTGMRLSNDLYLSKLTHKAVIDVTEIGTEAAAATGVTFIARSGYSRVVPFNVDHPFLFAIIHNPTGTVLFTGRVSDPS